MSTNVRDCAAERYNRRTRAIERQAEAATEQARALERIAGALEVQALSAALAATPVHTSGNNRVWSVGFASSQVDRLGQWVKELRR